MGHGYLEPVSSKSVSETTESEGIFINTADIGINTVVESFNLEFVEVSSCQTLGRFMVVGRLQFFQMTYESHWELSCSGLFPFPVLQNECNIDQVGTHMLYLL